MTKLSFAALATALLASSAPALAGDQDLSTLQQDSGRYVASTPARQVRAPQVQASQSRTVRPEAFDAYASAAPVARISRQAPSVQRNNGTFQGSNEATQYVTSY